ncbi:MAG: hypothetical protein QOF71_3313 [Candidatus Eremiobacteraeota bacterium]|nr:hypothetical protein [Candidatus Eremiobacteraeota bacterium]
MERLTQSGASFPGTVNRVSMTDHAPPASVRARAKGGEIRSLARLIVFIGIYALVEAKTSYHSVWPLVATVVGASAAAAGLALRYVWAYPGTLARNAFAVAVGAVGAFGLWRSIGLDAGVPGVFELATMPIWPVIGAVSLVPALRARVRPSGTVEIAPPLRGRMMTVNGGSTRATNHHLVEPSMRYAIDLVVVGPNGMRGDGLAPAALDRYLVFGRDVHSVVGGRVLVAHDEFPDQLPGWLNEQPLRGNHVVVSDGENELTYAHLKHGSVRVAVGDRVERGQVIAAVGNTGNSSEPHLHLHATCGDESVPLTIGGRYLVRNDLVVTEEP